jgi:hypothetical protein
VKCGKKCAKNPEFEKLQALQNSSTYQVEQFLRYSVVAEKPPVDGNVEGG